MRHVITVAVVLGLACGGEEQPQQPPATNAPATPQPVGQAQPVAPAGGAAPPTPTPAAGAGQSNFGTVALRPGFTPDPHVVRGTSGGAIQASNLNAQCRGWISQTPDHLFNAQGPFNNLRFVVNAGSEDTTLVVQKPDGTYLCNDDTDGFHPVVAGAFPPGMYKVWVGSYQRGTQAAYQLGISELGSVTPSSLGGGSAGGAAGSKGESGIFAIKHTSTVVNKELVVLPAQDRALAHQRVPHSYHSESRRQSRPKAQTSMARLAQTVIRVSPSHRSRRHANHSP